MAVVARVAGAVTAGQEVKSLTGRWLAPRAHEPNQRYRPIGGFTVADDSSNWRAQRRRGALLEIGLLALSWVVIVFLVIVAVRSLR